jgi:hypothetical protein
MLSHYDSPFGWRSYKSTAESVGFFGGTLRSSSETMTRQLFDQERERWREAELFYVSKPMLDLARSAALTLPSYKMEASDVPSRHGVMVFDGKLGTGRAESPYAKYPEGRRGEELPIYAVSWGPAYKNYRKWDGPGVWMTFYTYADDAIALDRAKGRYSEDVIRALRNMLGPFMLDDEFQYPFGVFNDGADRIEMASQIRGDHKGGWGAIVRTVWLLMNQAVTSSDTVAADRASTRRIERAGEIAKTVRVITLRHHSAVDPNADDSAGREYRHRWIVRGHWRNQWYPTQDRHVPIWIAPHVKGPETAPLLMGEKVYAWTR